MLKDMKTPQDSCDIPENLADEVFLDEPLDAETLAAIEDVNLGRNLIGLFTGIEELWMALEAE